VTELLTKSSSVDLSPAERERLAELEVVVERGRQVFIEVGLALAEIRDRRLYRERHGTFEVYLGERWGISRSRGYQLMAAAAVSTVVDSAGLPVPANEAQARELVPLLREGEARLLEVVRKVQVKYGNAYTAADIERLVSKDHEKDLRRQRALAQGGLGPPPGEPPPVPAFDHVCPKCGHQWDGCERPPGYHHQTQLDYRAAGQ
jgi:hypothetical protein